MEVRLAVSIATCVLFAVTAAFAAPSPDVVISQIYGGGGNTGAQFTNDFIEVFNRSGAAVSLAGLSVQYASSTGSFTQVTLLPNVTLNAGQYFLIQEAQGTGGTRSLPAPDTTGAINMSATAGKVALVRANTALNCGSTTATCSAAQLGLIVDLIGYGNANFFEVAAAPTLSNTTAALRNSAGCVDTDNNANDFSAGTPTPRNTTSALHDCAPSTALAAIGSANPSSVFSGDSTTLSVTVTPGQHPTSTGITVTGDLSLIGGPSSQGFTSTDGSHFSFTAAVSSTTNTGPVSIPITTTDAQGRTFSFSISLQVIHTIKAAIHDLQGGSLFAPPQYVGKTVTTSGIVTGVKTNGYFIQAADFEADSDPNTSEGIFVFTGNNNVPPIANVGNRLTVTGTLQDFIPSADPFSPPVTEIANSTATFVSSGNALPAAVTITSGDVSPSGSVGQLFRFEGMRVHVDSLVTVSPTGGTISEVNATSTSNGMFYGVFPGVPRPAREPGIEAPASIAGVPQFDGNPERIGVDTDALGGAPLNVTSNQTVSNITGPLDMVFRAYTIDADAAAPPRVSGAAMTAQPVSASQAGEVTVATFNMERFFDTVDDPSVSDAVLTSTAFNNRLTKASLVIRNILRTPDVIGVEEMENLPTLQAVADRLLADGGPKYDAYLVEGNDIGGIDVGFLVRHDRITVQDVTQYGKTTVFPFDGSLLNDRPPLVLHAIAHSTNGDYALTVIVNHLRSLSGIENPVDGDRVRRKRRAQAEYLANLIQTFQTASPSERIISIGDYNAYEFSDGYVDSLGTIMGTPTPAGQVLLDSPDLVDPNLSDLALTAPAATRYSYVFDGNTQSLDHVLVNHNITGRLEFAHNDADFPEVYRNDPTRPERISDHDMEVAYLSVPAPQLSISAPATGTYGTAFTVTITATDELNNVVSAYRGTVSITTSLQTNLPSTYTFTASDAGSHTFIVTPLGAGSNAIAFSNGTSASATVGIAPAPLTIAVDDKTASFGGALPQFTATYTGLVAGDVSSSLGALILSTDATVGSNAGSYAIHASGPSSPNYAIAFVDGTLTIKPAVTSLAVATASGQYSDVATLTATVSPANLAGQHADGVVTFSTGDVASVAADGTVTTKLSLAALGPGSYPISATYTSSNANFSGSSGSNTLTVSAEDAVVTYAGSFFVSTPSSTSSVATVTLRATIKDADDGHPGDLSHATVQFINLDTNTPISPVLPAGAGTVAFDWTVDTGSSDSQTFHIGVIVGRWYTGADDVLITVMKPSIEGVNGGGYLLLANPAGALGAAVGSKSNFGFNVKTNKNGSNVQGHINLVIRSAGHVYQVKADPSSLAGVPSSGSVTVIAKALIKDGSGTVEPNASLEMSMTDSGEPGIE